MQDVLALLSALDDGRAHTRDALAAQLRIDAATLDRTLAKLCASGWEVMKVDETLRLGERVEWLDANALAAHCATRELEHLAIVTATESTNTWLLERPPVNAPRACLAEWQYAGRGRRGRRWRSPPARDLALSIAWPLDGDLSAWRGFSLATGVAVAGALQQHGAEGIALKWPNDILAHGAKLGGLLVETRVSGERTTLVAGVGLNLLPCSHELDQPYADLASVLPAPVTRNQIAGSVLVSLCDAFAAFREHGFSGIRYQFAELDATRDQRVEIAAGGRQETGVSQGVNDAGELCLLTVSGLRTVDAGEVSLRIHS